MAELRAQAGTLTLPRQPLASGFFYQRLSERMEERETTRPGTS